MALIAPARIPADHLLAALHARKRVPGYRHFCAALSPCGGAAGVRCCAAAGGLLEIPRCAFSSRSVRTSRFLVWLQQGGT